MPAFLTRFRKRYALLAGLALSILAACILSNFILVIDVTGNERVSRAEILSALNQLGFGVGSYGPAVDERDLVNRALLELEDVGFLTINIKGIRAEVVVREAPVKPEIVDKNKRADVVAVRDGVILEVGAKAGKEMVKEGDAVLKGEVLISGLVTYENGTGESFSSRQLRAEGRGLGHYGTYRMPIPALENTGEGFRKRKANSVCPACVGPPDQILWKQ